MLLTAGRTADGQAVAILPLYVARARPLRVVRFLGHGISDELGPVFDARNGSAGITALRQALEAPAWDWDVFLGDLMPGNEHWSALLAGKEIRREASPVLRIGGRTWDDFLASRSGNFREQGRRRERKLAREHNLRYRLADSDSLEEDFETLLRLHRARWAEQDTTDFIETRDFQWDFALQALERGWLRLWVMEIDDRPVAAWYGFRFGDAECYYQAGRDPEWDGYSVGFVILAHTIREAFNDGLEEYRLLRGGESYKDRFASGGDELQTVVVCRGVAARAAFALASAMPSRGKDLVTSLVR